jgi:hypothetical protein
MEYVHGPVDQVHELTGLRTSHKMLVVQLMINGSDLKAKGVSSRSNSRCLLEDG